MLMLVWVNPYMPAHMIPKFSKRRIFEIEDEAVYLVTFPDPANTRTYDVYRSQGHCH